MLFIAEVSTNDEGHHIKMNFTVLKGYLLTDISKWSKKPLSKGSVVSDGLACFKAAIYAECEHCPIVTGRRT